MSVSMYTILQCTRLICAGISVPYVSAGRDLSGCICTEVALLYEQFFAQRHIPSSLLRWSIYGSQ